MQISMYRSFQLFSGITKKHSTNESVKHIKLLVSHFCFPELQFHHEFFYSFYKIEYNSIWSLEGHVEVSEPGKHIHKVSDPIFVLHFAKELRLFFVTVEELFISSCSS